MWAGGLRKDVENSSLNHAGNAPYDFIELNFLSKPRFLVTVDTEEEFDWTKPFSRDGHGTKHVTAIEKFQSLCQQNNIKPCYLIDYPIAIDPVAIEILGGYVKQGAATIGAQLHPWVNPPHLEEVNINNSFVCNLPLELQHQKLFELLDQITKNYHVMPDIYRAGRYGAGPDTKAILQNLGVRIDTSVRSNFDYTNIGGPNYSQAPLNPYWLIKGALAELPLTTVFSGGLQKYGPQMFNEYLSSCTTKSILARTGLLERIALTPEGIPLQKAIEGIDCAIRDQVKILNFSFHSPSLAPGHTPYVRTEEALDHFYAWWAGVFRHLEKREIKPICVNEIVTRLFP
jgi:hypothetical protein